MLCCSLSTYTLTYPEAHATTYDYDLMEDVSINRGLPIVDCMVSSPFHPDSVGITWLLVKSKITGVELLCRVTDTSQNVNTSNTSGKTDIERHREDKLFEFDTYSWMQLCNTRYVGEQSWYDCIIDVYELKRETHVRQISSSMLYL